MSDDSSLPDDDLELGDENAKVFLSYSRKDRHRAQRIADVLRDRHFGVFKDTDDILPTEEWRGRLEQLIAESDTIVFLLSPHSASSEVCAWEVDLARSLNKRIAPIVIDDVPAEEIPEPLTHLNFIFCTERDRFEDAVDSLVSALGTDIEWIREHTRMAGLARRWRDQGQPARLLLRGQDISDAEHWRDERPEEAPVLTEAQSVFIAESRRQAIRRQRRWIGGSFAVAAATLALAVVAVWQGLEADRQRDAAETNAVRAEQNAAEAQENARRADANAARADARAREAQRNLDQALRTQSRFLADLGMQQTRGPSTDLAAAKALALEALPDATPGPDGKPLSIRPATPQAERLLFDATIRNREQLAMTGHGPGIGSLELSPDGARLLSTGGDFTPMLWDIESGRRSHVLSPHAWVLNGASFSPDGKTVLTSAGDPSGHDRNLRLFDVETGKLLKEQEAHEKPLLSAVFVDGGAHIVTTSRASDACIWRTADLSKVSCLTDMPAMMTADRRSVAQDGKHVALRMRNDVVVWSIDEPARTTVLRGHEALIVSALFSPDGRTLTTVGGDGSFAIWDGTTGDAISKPARLPKVQAIQATVYRPDSARVVFGTRGGEVIFVNVADAEVYGRYNFELGEVFALAYDADGARVAMGGSNARVAVMRADGWEPKVTLEGVDDGVTALVFTADGQRLITGGRNGSIRIWDVQPASEKITGFERVGHGFDQSPNGRYYLAGNRQDASELAMLDLTTRKEVFRLKNFGAQVRTAQFTGDGDRLVVGLWNGRISILDATDGTELHAMDVGAPGLVIGGIVELDDGRLVISFHQNGGDAPPIRIVSFNAPDTGETLASSQNPNRKLAITPDQTRLAAMSYRELHLWDLTARRRIAVLPDHEAYLRDMAFSPDSTLLATVADDSTVRLWRSSDGNPIHVMEGHGKRPKDWRGGDVDFIVIESVEFDAAGERLITASKDRTARIWDVKTGALLGVLEGHNGSLLTARFSPDGQRAATISWDGKVRIFDTATSGLLREIRIADGGNGSIQKGDVRFAPDGRSVLHVSAKGAGMPGIAPDLQPLVDRAKAAIPRCLPVDARRAAFLAPGPPRWCITGPGLETEPASSKWQPLHPYRNPAWRDWLIARDAGESPRVPDTD